VDTACTPARVAAILNAAYLVRMYCRPFQQRARAQALRNLGLECREAFNASEDFEPLLVALVDGLAPREERRF
jgi:hypothetical protein